MPKNGVSGRAEGGIQNNVAMAWRKKGPKEVGPNWSTIRKYGEKDIIECEICK